MRERTRAVAFVGPALLGLALAQAACGAGAVEGGTAASSAEAEPQRAQVEVTRDSPCGEGMALVGAARLSITRDDGSSEHDVAAFCLDRTEVSAAAYEGCVHAGACGSASLGETPSGEAPPSDACTAARDDRRERPINCVDFDQASAFCRWRGARLPSGVEWELAARGAEGRPFPWGAAPPDETRVWARTIDEGVAGPAVVDSFPAGASPEGVLHLADNVAEWTDEARASVIVVPGPATERPMRAVFGGSFESSDPARHAGDTSLAMHEDERAAFLGFRCARTLEEGAR